MASFSPSRAPEPDSHRRELDGMVGVIESERRQFSPNHVSSAEQPPVVEVPGSGWQWVNMSLSGCWWVSRSQWAAPRFQYLLESG